MLIKKQEFQIDPQMIGAMSTGLIGPFDLMLVIDCKRMICVKLQEVTPAWWPKIEYKQFWVEIWTISCWSISDIPISENKEISREV